MDWIALAEMLAEAVGPPLAKLLAAGIESLTASIKAANMPVTAAGVVREIVAGLDRDHPDWTGEEKRCAAQDAVAQYLGNHGAVPSPAAINALLEIAVQANLGGAKVEV